MAKLEKNVSAVGEVCVVNGVGNDPMTCSWEEGDTVTAILEKLNIELEDGDTVTLGRKRIEDIETATVNAGDKLVIARKVSNG